MRPRRHRSLMFDRPLDRARHKGAPQNSVPCDNFGAFRRARDNVLNKTPENRLDVDSDSEPECVPMTPEDEFKYITTIPETRLPDQPRSLEGAIGYGSDHDSRESVERKDALRSSSQSLGRDETRITPFEANKGLREVPRSAPRSIQRIGKFNFRQGVRIRDYKVPRRQRSASPTASREYQGRDGFEAAEMSLGSPQPMTRRHEQRTPDLEPTMLETCDSLFSSPDLEILLVGRCRRSRPIILSSEAVNAAASTPLLTESQSHSPRSVRCVIKLEDEDDDVFRKWLVG